MREQIKHLILAGTSKEDIIKIVGCSAEYIAELIVDSEFTQEVKQARIDKLDMETETEYAKLEHSALKKVKDNLEYYDATALCKVLETVSRTRLNRQSQRTAQAGNPANHFNNPTVGIAVTVPVFLGNSDVILDSKKQVVAINGRNMAALPTDQVHALFSTLEKEQRNDQPRIEEDPILVDRAEREALAAARATRSSRESVAA